MAATPARIAEVLAGLRASSARLCVGSLQARERIATGLPIIDEALGGGLCRGRLSELYGRGRLSWALGILAAGQARGELVALVDGANALCPDDAARAGVVLPGCLWVRAPSTSVALKATDRVLEAGGFSTLVVYLSRPESGRAGRKLENLDGLMRLVQRAERARTAVLFVAETPTLGSYAAASLELRRARPRWVSSGGVPRLLDGYRVEVVVARNKTGQEGASASLDIGVLGETPVLLPAMSPSLLPSLAPVMLPRKRQR